MFGAELEVLARAEVALDDVEDVQFGAEVGGVVGRANEWAAGDVFEAFLESDFF